MEDCFELRASSFELLVIEVFSEREWTRETGNSKLETRNSKLNIMGDWTGLAIIGFLVICALFGLWQLTKPYEISVEEFEKRAHEAPGMLSAGFTAIQKILDPATTKAIVAQEDFKQGRFDAEQGKGDGDEAGAAAKDQQQDIVNEQAE